MVYIAPRRLSRIEGDGNPMIGKIVRAAVGVTLIALGVALALTTPSTLMTVGKVSLLLRLFGQQSLTLIWRLLLVPVLFVAGASFLLAILDDTLPRASIRSKGRSVVAILGWGILYLVYMVTRSLSGRPMVLDSFDFSRPVDFIYLLLLGSFVAIILRMTLRPSCIADVKATFVGLVGGAFLGSCTYLWGPVGVPEGHPLRTAVFIALLPLLLLTPIGVLAMGVNLSRSLRLRGMRHRASSQRGVETS